MTKITIDRATVEQALEWIEDAVVVLSHTSSAIQGGIGAEAEGVGSCSVKTITALRQALSDSVEQPAQQQSTERVEPGEDRLGGEWVPCVKLPVVVHVRNQRLGEQHVSTREGITPVKPDDLIMRGVAGEEYPIGRELWEKTYTTDLTQPVIDKSAAIRIATALGWEQKREWVGLTDEEIGTLANEHLDVGDGICGRNFVIGEIEFARATEAMLKGKNCG